MSKAAILSSAVVQHVARILANGTKYSKHPHIDFQAHDGLLIKLRTAAEQADEEAFFKELSTYLKEAATHVPHAGREGEVDEVILHLKLLAHDHQHGFANLSSHLLAVAYAPVDRF